MLATRISPASPNFGQAKQGQKFVVPTFHIHFLNPECVTIPWVLAPKNFPIENFRVLSDLQKRSTFAYSMPYIFGKLWHLAIIWAIRKAFQCILQGVRILLAKYTPISPTSENESYIVVEMTLNMAK